MKIKIEKMVYGGNGLGFHEGKAVFVPFVLPEEFVEVDLVKERKDHSFGSLKKIITESPDRIESQCPNFTVCGGCDYLHVAYEKELQFKRSIIEDSLIRVGKLCPELIPEIDILASDRFFYRRVESHCRRDNLATLLRGGFGCRHPLPDA